MGALSAALLIAGSALAWPVSAWAGGASRIIHFHGYRLTAPAGWPVFDLAAQPATCVRFNRHAIYLGVPRADQQCPAHQVGHTEAILVAPVTAGPLRRATPGRATAALRRATAAAGRVLPVTGSASTFAAGPATVVVTATWSRDRRLVSRILGGGLNPVPARTRPPSTATRRFGRLSRSGRAAGSKLRAHPSQAIYGGLGFDACSAPSTNAMSAWAASPYRAVNIYIGGTNSACSQPNLTAAWASAQVSAGWHLIPTYVGLQGKGSCGGTCATMNQDPSRATAQGTAAANDAVTQAQALGIPAGNPIYDDMEGYSQSPANTSAVLAFLSGWTTQLHALGYVSGVYSSASSGIRDLVNANGTGYTEPDDIWIANWNDRHTTSDPYVPSSDWANHQRIHQYQGAHDESYGGVTLNIDGDFLDGATADTAPTVADGTFVQVFGMPAIYRIAGGAPLLISSWSGFGAPQPYTVISPQQFTGLRPYPADGTFLTTTTGGIYRVAGGAPIGASDWAVFGGPQPSVTIDQWDIDNLSSPLSHLRASPLDGTIVTGVPSGAYWSFSGGQRSSVSPTPSAVAVDDVGLSGFPQAPLTGGVGGAPQPHQVALRCVVPRLKHKSLVRARAALRKARCRVGHVTRPRHWSRHHHLRVSGQSARPHSRHPRRYKVNLRLS